LTKDKIQRRLPDSKLPRNVVLAMCLDWSEDLSTAPELWLQLHLTQVCNKMASVSWSIQKYRYTDHDSSILTGDWLTGAAEESQHNKHVQHSDPVTIKNMFYARYVILRQMVEINARCAATLSESSNQQTN